MHIFIDNRSGTPIYEQIFTQLQAQIVDGSLGADEALPSIRQLAKDLRISVITTRRAYDELERAGFIYTVAGKGCFVAPRNPSLEREENLKKIEEHMSAILRLAALCGLGDGELAEMLALLREENHECH